MKRKALDKALREGAKQKGLELKFVREGANHEIWKMGSYQFSIPRHSDINELTAKGILDGTEEAK